MTKEPAPGHDLGLLQEGRPYEHLDRIKKLRTFTIGARPDRRKSSRRHGISRHRNVVVTRSRWAIVNNTMAGRQTGRVPSEHDFRAPLNHRHDRTSNDVPRLHRGTTPQTAALTGNASEPEAIPGIIGASSALTELLRLVRAVAPTDSTVLITGESGTGKELVARAVHDLSGRRSNRFVKMSCAAIPTGLLESELFGYEKGAFTGAVASQIGRFELANLGSVFLDEIGEMALELQPKLLRVLQEHEFERLGSPRTIRTDARLIAATNRNIEGAVDDGAFRGDLFYRLNVFPIHVPSLRERADDIPSLAWHFVRLFAKRMYRPIETIPADTMAALTRHAWPGNIRELQNVLERAVILSPGPVLQIPLRDLQSPAPSTCHVNGAKWRTLEEAERAHILLTLQETGWMVGGPNGAASALGINRTTLQFRMKRLGIVRPRSPREIARNSMESYGRR